MRKKSLRGERVESSLPKFRREDAKEPMLVGDSSEPRLGERCSVVGEMGRPQTGEDPEGEVQASDKELCRETHDAVRNTEV